MYLIERCKNEMSQASDEKRSSGSVQEVDWCKKSNYKYLHCYEVAQTQKELVGLT